MDLLQLMQKSRAQLMPYWILSIGVCVVYALIVGLPSELNTFGELLSLLLAGPLQLGLCIYFLKITQGKEVSFFDLFEGFKPLLNVLLAFVIINALTILGLLFFYPTRYYYKLRLFNDLLPTCRTSRYEI